MPKYNTKSRIVLDKNGVKAVQRVNFAIRRESFNQTWEATLNQIVPALDEYESYRQMEQRDLWR